MRFGFWRTICAAFAVLALSGPPSLAHAADEMSFRVLKIGDPSQCGADCPLVISAIGRITENTPDQFLSFVQRNSGRDNLHSVVFIDSPGGRVLAAMEFGSLLRKIGAATVVARVYPDGAGGTTLTNAQCFSACVYAFMGGRKRVVPGASQIGIHRMYAYEDTVDQSGTALIRHRRFDNGDMRAVLMTYSTRMGVDPALIAAAERIPPDRLHVLSRSEIKHWRLGGSKL